MRGEGRAGARLDLSRLDLLYPGPSPKKSARSCDRAVTLGEELSYRFSCFSGSELLHVHHVPEAARDGVLRVEGVGEGRVGERRVAIGDVVHADGDAAVPRGVPGALEVD